MSEQNLEYTMNKKDAQLNVDTLSLSQDVKTDVLATGLSKEQATEPKTGICKDDEDQSVTETERNVQFSVGKVDDNGDNVRDQTDTCSPQIETPSNPALTQVIFKFRDKNKKMVDSWKEAFKNHSSRVQVSCGDIFKGAPAADALVSPANSFGFMDGGIDMAFSMHFGWQMQERLQKVIHQEYDGEILVINRCLVKKKRTMAESIADFLRNDIISSTGKGQAAIIPAFSEGTAEGDTCIAGCNEDRPIKYLISAPTMRVPLDVIDTANAFLAFRAIILAVRKHNNNPMNKECQIRSVLCPGLGTAVGRMPAHRCAKQMVEAFTAYELGLKPGLLKPRELGTVWSHHSQMAQF